MSNMPTLTNHCDIFTISLNLVHSYIYRESPTLYVAYANFMFDTSTLVLCVFKIHNKLTQATRN